MRASRHYMFAGQTTSLCETCVQLVPAKIIFEAGNVYFLKHCATHGTTKTLVSTDIPYYLRCREAVAAYSPTNFRREFDRGCPYDCGLCADHEQHSCAAIIEIIDDCNMTCPTCIASSYPGAGNQKSLTLIERMLDTIVASEGEADIVMISGGEPTIHPYILEILALVQTKAIQHTILITNGVRLAQDRDFVQKLRLLGRNFEVYLQFDSLQAEALVDIRGKDLREVRAAALRNLEEAGISTTLVAVVKKGVNDAELGSIVAHARTFSCVRGVTFQPVKATGRNESFEYCDNYITMSEVRRALLESIPELTAEEFVPHPCNPENIAIAYMVKLENRLLPVTTVLMNGRGTSETAIATSFQRSAELRSMLYFLPDLSDGDFNYENLFRVTIISFLDKFNFCVASVKQSCIHFVTEEQEIIPLDTYYLLYSGKTRGTLLSLPIITDDVSTAPSPMQPKGI